MPFTFVPFKKIPRLSRDMVVQEKLDGTNASIHITADGEFITCSRNRIITQGDDNYGFAKWAHERKDELMKLGVGSHFGEWWGQGIQRGYGLAEKRFSLFHKKPGVEYPDCVSFAPVLYTGKFDTALIEDIVDALRSEGSKAVRGFMDPEGVVVWHEAAGCYFKKTCKDDGMSKSERDAIYYAANPK